MVPLPLRGQTADPRAAAVDSVFRSIDSATTPGCVVGADSAGHRLLLRAYGRRDLEVPTPNDSLTVFEAGSVSKQVTAGAVVLLALQGRLSLDDDVRRWIPELHAFRPRITIRHLLAHQSGLHDCGDVLELSGWPRGTRAYSMDDHLALVARQRELNFAPGTAYSYSNSNYVLAATIVRRAAGMSFDAFTDSAIFRPLGMTHTRWRSDYRARVPRRAIAWTPDDSSRWTLDMPFEDVVGHGGLLTTVPDLLRWLGNLDRPRVGGAEFARLLQTEVPLVTGRPTGYGLGLDLDSLAGEPLVSHSGATAGYRAWAGRLPRRGIAVALLCNDGALDTRSLGVAAMLAAASLHPPDHPAEPDLGGADSTGPGGAAAGWYRNGRTGQPVEVTMFARGLRLDGWQPYARQPDGTYRSADGTRTLRLLGPGPRPLRAFERDTRPTGFRIVRPAGDSVDYARLAPWTGSLRALAGTYRSDEAATVWTLAMRGDSLVIERRPGQRDAAVPFARDRLRVPTTGWILTVRRDARGVVSGLDVALARSWKVPFDRVRR